MKIIEKIYLGISVFPLAATLAFLGPEEFIKFVWGGGREWEYGVLLYSIFSLILGIFGVVLIALAINKNHDVQTLVIATLFSSSLFFYMVFYSAFF